MTIVDLRRTTMARKAMHLRIVSQNKLMGPLPLDVLVQMAAEGRICAEDLVRPGGSRTWLHVTEVPELAARLAASPVAEPSPPLDDDADLAEAGDARAPLRIGRRRRYEEAAMDMAPMIDVTFLLLIFFMLTNSLANQAAMAVPEAVHGRGVNLEGRQLVLVDQNGTYYLGDTADEKSAADSLDALVAEVQKNAQASEVALDVIVSAHRDVKHRHVRQLLEGLATVEGLGEILLGVEEKRN